MKALTTKEAAERLGVTVRRVNELITSGRLPAARFGRAYMIKESDLKLVEDRKPGRPLAKVSASIGARNRIINVSEGHEYLVNPLNPAKLKHRGRRCIVLEVISVSENHPRDFVAKVKFLDNNRTGRVELGDLVPVESNDQQEK